MVRMMVLAALAAGLVAMPGAVAHPPKEEKKTAVKPAKADRAKIEKLLNTEKVKYDKDLQKTVLPEVLGDLAKKYDVTFIIDKTAFPKDAGDLTQAAATRLAAAKPEGLSLGQFLDAYLRGLSVNNVTYVVRPDYIEITSLAVRLQEKQKRAFPKQNDKGAPPPAVKPGDVGRIVSALQNERVAYDRDLTTTPLPEVLTDLARRYDLQFVIDKRSFEDIGLEDAAPLDDATATRLRASRLDGLTLHSFLRLYLRSLSVPNVTYMVRDGYIEIIALESALKQAGLDEGIDEAANSEDPTAMVKAQARLKLPLVCVVVEDRPLSEVLGTLARVYGLNIVIDTAAREQTQTRLTERLLNVPADTALELLARQAGLGVVRKGNVFRLTADGGF